ncbi:MAG: LysM peptidoglycan-binding domain-containing protein [Chloroflexota bacterium]
MKTNRSFVFFTIVLLLVISLSACTKSASKGSTATPAGQTTPLADATGVIDTLILASTQTAMVAGSVPTAVMDITPQATEIVVVAPPTEMPTPMPTAVSAALPTPELVVPASYTLHSGEFPFCIARRFNVNPTDLLNINNLGGGTYYAGMVLKIPQNGRTFPGNRTLRAHPTTYTAKAGDTVYSVACLFGDVSPEAIIAANALQAPYKLTSGQILNIP